MFDSNAFINAIKEAVKEVIEEQSQKGSPAPNNPWLNIEQAADYLKMKVNTLYEKTSKRLIPHYKNGKTLIFKTDELDEYLKSKKVSTHAALKRQADNMNYD